MPLTEREREKNRERQRRFQQRKRDKLLALGLPLPKIKRYRKSQQIAKASRYDDGKDENVDSCSMSPYQVKTEAFEQLNIVEHSFCRCCFKSMDIMERHFPVDEGLVAIFRDLTQLTIESCLQAPNFCESCYNQTHSLNHFKKLTVARQTKFSEFQSGHRDFRELYQLHLLSESVETIIKEEKLTSEVIEQEHFLDDESSPEVRSKCRAKSNDPDKNYFPREMPKKENFQVHSSTPFDACQICGIRVRSMKCHIEKVHDKVKRFFCDICDFGAYLKSQITKHVRTTHMIPGIFCDWCDYKTTSNYSLEKHLDTQHAGKRVAVPCTAAGCNKTFFWRHNLKSHIMRCHEKIKPFTCSHCGMSFFGQGALRAHMRNKHEARTQVCHICGAAYGTTKSLKYHIATHSQAELTCDYCSKRFIHKQSILKHIKTVHMKIRNHVCESCGKGFRDNDMLYIHTLQHRGIKFPCFVPGCTSAVTSKAVLMFHVRKNHSLSKAEQEEFKRKLADFWDTIKPKK